MGRSRRQVHIGVPHHVAHRGNHRQILFSSDDDRRLYLAFLYRFSRITATRIAGFCLMSNHIHVIAIPSSIRGLSSCFSRTHRAYSEHLNHKKGKCGTNWEGRFFSVPMSEVHAINALRYVERNPVEAGMVAEATDWPWSSAQMHCGGGKRWGLVGSDIRPDTLTNADWRRMLKKALDEEELQSIPWAAIVAPSNARSTGSAALIPAGGAY
jgi:putative transposase